jgi:endonuclease III
MNFVMETVKEITVKLGGLFSKELGINLQEKSSEEVFKWFVASLLFGARISETIAKNTYREFEKDDLLTPEKILRKGWDGLVFTLDKGGYVRYDYKTADKFLEVMGNLKKKYKGDLNYLHGESTTSRDLEQRLKDLGKGIGNVTVNIFLRELREIWEKAHPLPQDLTVKAAKNLGLLRENVESSLEELVKIWDQSKVEGYRFSNFETALLRIGKDYCRKNKCNLCPAKTVCTHR